MKIAIFLIFLCTGLLALANSSVGVYIENQGTLFRVKILDNPMDEDPHTGAEIWQLMLGAQITKKVKSTQLDMSCTSLKGMQAKRIGSCEFKMPINSVEEVGPDKNFHFQLTGSEAATILSAFDPKKSPREVILGQNDLILQMDHARTVVDLFVLRKFLVQSFEGL